MDNFQLIILLMSIAVLLVGFAEKIQIPYPLALVLGGAVLGFLPGLQGLSFNPNLILVIVLPPILNYGSFWISFLEFRKNLLDIFSLAIGLVIVTTFLIGIIFKWLFPELPWALAFAFGAIVSPPDATATLSVLKRFNISSHLLTVLEAESLINDAAALVLYRIAVGALLTGVFSWTQASIEFTKITMGGILVGIGTGFTIQIFSSRYLTPTMGVMFSFFIPYIVYIFADSIGVSGVLAVVINGLILGRMFVKHHSPFRRILAVPSWDLFIILLNCFVFILIGLQLRTIVERTTLDQMFLNIAYGFLFTAILIIIRMLWVNIKYAISYLHARYEFKSTSHCNQILREGVITGWAGMRGIVSLAAVLALPFNLSGDIPLAGRDDVVFITFVIILLTLLIPGFTLPILLKHLRIHHTYENPAIYRKKLLSIASEIINSVSEISEEDRIFLLTYFTTRHRVMEISSSKEQQNQRLEKARRKILQAQREHLLKMWENKEIDDKLLKLLEIELELEESISIHVENK